MSQHSTIIKKKRVVIGVDRPLRYVFATIYAPKGGLLRTFNQDQQWSADESGLLEAFHAVEMHFKGKPVIPESMRKALKEDIERLYKGLDINYSKQH
jgi:hypothetical protein